MWEALLMSVEIIPVGCVNPLQVGKLGIYGSIWYEWLLTYWGQDRMAAVLQMACSN